MTSEQLALLGEEGRRTERTEWGVSFPALPGLWRAHTSPAADEEHANTVAEHSGLGAYPVSRTVVTYTTAWTRQKSPPPPPAEPDQLPLCPDVAGLR